MKKLTILISSPQSELAKMLRVHLDAQAFQIVSVVPGPGFVKAVRRRRPDIAVLDRVHERPEVARMEIEVLYDAQPKVRIIALSESAKSDAAIVEQGLFYYMTQSPEPELARVIEAAARACRTPEPGATGDPTLPPDQSTPTHEPKE